MKHIKWAISTEAFEKPGYPKLTDALKRSGTEFFNAKFDRGLRFYEDIPYNIYDPVVLYGPIQFVRKNMMAYTPGAFGFKSNMRTSYYMSLYDPDLFFNSRAIYLPFGLISKNKDVFKLLYSDEIFIRPDSGFKSFTGFTTTLDDLDYELSTRKQTHNPDNMEMCLISSAKEILGEFRFVIADGEVITGSQYRWDNKLDIRIDIDHSCWKFAEQIAKLDNQLDSVYTVDIFLTGDGPTIGEFNSFASAGLYNCDMDKIVEAVNMVSLRETENANFNFRRP